MNTQRVFVRVATRVNGLRFTDYDVARIAARKVPRRMRRELAARDRERRELGEVTA